MSLISSYSLISVFRYLPKFAGYVFRHFPSASFAVIITILGIVLEYAALSVMLPLAASTGQTSEGASIAISFWQQTIETIGLADEPRTWLWLFLLLLGARITVSFIQTALNTWVSKSILAHLSSETFTRTISLEPLTEIYRKSVGHYIALAGDEAVRIGQVFFHFSQALSAIVAAGIGLIVLYSFSPVVFDITLVFLLFSALSIILVMKWVISWSNESALLSRETNSTFVEAFNGIRSIRSMAGEEFVAQRYCDFLERYRRVLFLLDVFNHGTRAVPGLILILLGLIVLLPSAGYFQDFSAIYFFTVTTMLVRVLSFLGTAVTSGGRVVIDIRAAFYLDDILESTLKPDVEPDKKTLSLVNSITFTNISCGYNRDQPILKDVTAQLKAGKSYALVGRSGAGKSTLSDVLLGLLTPITGELSIDGLPYDQINAVSLRRKVVLVEQQTRIFSGTIRENIGFGLSISDVLVKNAVEGAGLREFVDSLSHGLETRIDYQGSNISGGQRQRIGLARAIIRQPDVLILDEATSALDRHTRNQVINYLLKEFSDRIILFITHDSHVVQAVDEVWHIKNNEMTIEANT